MGSRGTSSRARQTSQRAASELASRSQEYVDRQPETYAGSWLDWDGDTATYVVAFTGDLAPHRAALDPAIRVVGAERPYARLREIQDEVFEVFDDFPGVELSGAGVYEDRNVLEVEVFAHDPAPLQRALDERYGPGFAVVHVEAAEPYASGYVHWTAWALSDDRRRLILRWWGGGTRSEYAVVEDGPDEVRATVHVEYYLGAVAAVSMPCSVEVDLPTPLAGRRVVDGAPFDGLAPP